MLRRIANRLSSGLLTPAKLYTFSQQNSSGSQPKRHRRTFVSQFELQILMFEYMSTLQSNRSWEQQKLKLDSKHGQKQETWRQYLIKMKNKYNEQDKRKGQGNQAPRSQFAENFSKFNRILFAFIITYYLFSDSNEPAKPMPEFNRGIRRVVNEHEMIALLATGNFNPEIVILREMVFGDQMKKIYQTICQAKEANKSDVPVTCIVTNLPLLLQRIESLNIPYKVNFHYYAEEIEPSMKIDIFSIIIYGFLGYVLFKLRSSLSGGMKNGLNQMLNLKKYEPIKPENIKTLFKDVAGMHEAKKEVTEFVDFLKSPDKYIQMGAKIPKGALLTGPPGTGKTLLARACAGEAGVPFFYVSGSEFVEKYVGLGASRVRNLFTSAAKVAPSIIFIDEIDAIGKKRNSGPFSNEEKENTLNQLLVNMDGFDSKNKIIVMAATNLKDSLDPALLRPGRFDRSIEITLPNFEQRIEILKVHLAKVKYSEKFTIDQLAKKVSILTTGFSGADLANICNEAAILAAREGKEGIELPQFEKATERVMAGLEKRNLFSDQQKECLAYYECGKAVASWFTEGADPIIKISIAPFSKHGKGYSHQIKDQMPLRTQSELLNKATCYLAGRTAQQFFKGYITSNGDADLKKAKRIVSVMVSKLGMSPVIGRIGFPDIEYTRKPYSDETESKIDKEVDRIYKECQARAENLIKEKAELIEKLKVLILEKQTLTHNTLKEILGERPFQDNENYSRFLKESGEKEEEEQVTITPPSPQFSPQK